MEKPEPKIRITSYNVCYTKLLRFFPATFTVQEVFYAAAIELIKVAIIAIPLMLVVAVSLSYNFV